MFEKWFNIDHKIISLYKNDLELVKPSVYEVVFDNDWHSRIGFRDLKKLEKTYYECAGVSWPNTWEQFLVLYENKQLGALEKEILDRYQFRKKMIRTDYHPTPAEHLEYLQKVVPEIHHSDETIEWVHDINNLVLTQKKFVWSQGNKVERF